MPADVDYGNNVDEGHEEDAVKLLKTEEDRKKAKRQQTKWINVDHENHRSEK